MGDVLRPPHKHFNDSSCAHKIFCSRDPYSFLNTEQTNKQKKKKKKTEGANESSPNFLKEPDTRG